MPDFTPLLEDPVTIERIKQLLEIAPKLVVTGLLEILILCLEAQEVTPETIDGQ